MVKIVQSTISDLRIQLTKRWSIAKDLLEEMNKESFDNFYARYAKERCEIMEVIQKQAPQISNLKKSIEEALDFSTKLATVWTSSPVSTKEKLKKARLSWGHCLFKEKWSIWTKKVNSFFELVADRARDCLRRSLEWGASNKIKPALTRLSFLFSSA